MSVDQELLADIDDHLQNDILHFAWLRQMVRLKRIRFNETESIGTVLDLVSYLHDNGTIIVGSARDADGTVLIDPWPESNSQLRARMESAIADSNEQDRDFCFWIQLSRHVSR